MELKNAKCVLLLVSSRRLHRERLASSSLCRLCHPVIRGVWNFCLNSRPVLVRSAETAVGERLEAVVSRAVDIAVDGHPAISALKSRFVSKLLMSPSAVPTRHRRSGFERARSDDELAVALRGVRQRWSLCERRAHSGLESEENFGGDSDETPEHFGGLLAELSLRHGKQRTHLGKTSRLEMATKKFV